MILFLIIFTMILFITNPVYGLINLNDSGNFTNTTAGEVIHLSDIQEDQIVAESGDDLLIK